MGYELAEDFGWKLPDAILYPTGGGTGLIGMWKAFDEMEELGWIGSDAAEDDRRPGRGLRADPEGVRRGQGRLGEVSERAHLRLGPARAEGVRRLPDPPVRPRLRRLRHRGHRRRDAPRPATRSAPPRASSSRPRAARSGRRRRSSRRRACSRPTRGSSSSTRGAASSTSDGASGRIPGSMRYAVPAAASRPASPHGGEAGPLHRPRAQRHAQGPLAASGDARARLPRHLRDRDEPHGPEDPLRDRQPPRGVRLRAGVRAVGGPRGEDARDRIPLFSIESFAPGRATSTCSGSRSRRS